MNIFKYFKRIGIDTIAPSFYAQVRLWQSWYEGDVSKFHHFYVYNGKTKVRCRRLSLGMAKKLCEDIADLLLNEKVMITINDESTSEFVHSVLERNKFLTKGNQYQELKAALGTVAYVVQLKDVTLSEDGSILRGGPENVAINYVRAENIYPISWENGEISEVAFTFPKTVYGKKYMLVQTHQLRMVNGIFQYVIQNHVVTNGDNSGKEIPPEKWNDLKPFAGLAAEILTGSDKPQFVIDRLNIVNNADQDDTNPMGASLFANSIDVLAKIDLEFDSYANEFDLGRKRIFVAPEMLSQQNGEPVFDENDTIFYQLPEDALEGGDPIREINMEIRAEDHSRAINDDLNYLSFKSGFGTHRYRFENGNVKTATEVISENSDMYRTLKKHEVLLESVLLDLIQIIIRLGQTLKIPVDPQTEVKIDFDDSIIEDKTAERQQDRNDVAMGALSLTEYRMKWYGETEDQAKANLPEQIGVME